MPGAQDSNGWFTVPQSWCTNKQQQGNNEKDSSDIQTKIQFTSPLKKETTSKPSSHEGQMQSKPALFQWFCRSWHERWWSVVDLAPVQQSPQCCPCGMPWMPEQPKPLCRSLAASCVGNCSGLSVTKAAQTKGAAFRGLFTKTPLHWQQWQQTLWLTEANQFWTAYIWNPAFINFIHSSCVSRSNSFSSSSVWPVFWCLFFISCTKILQLGLPQGELFSVPVVFRCCHLTKRPRCKIFPETSSIFCF